MIEFIIFNLLFLVILLIQWTIVPIVAIRDIQPNIPLIYLVFWSWRHSRFYGTVAGFMSGLISDLFGGGLWGQQALSKSITGYLAGSISVNRYGIRLVVVFGLVLGLSFIHEMLILVISCWRDLGILPGLILRYVIPSSIYTALVGSAIQIMMGLIKRHRSS